MRRFLGIRGGTAWPGRSQTLFDIFREKKPDIDIIGVLVRPGRAKETQKKVGRKVPVVETLKALLKLKPDVVVEAASQQAVRDWGETILNKGIDLMVIATGAWLGAVATVQVPRPESRKVFPACGMNSQA